MAFLNSLFLQLITVLTQARGPHTTRRTSGSQGHMLSPGRPTAAMHREFSTGGHLLGGRPGLVLREPPLLVTLRKERREKLACIHPVLFPPQGLGGPARAQGGFEQSLLGQEASHPEDGELECAHTLAHALTASLEQDRNAN